MKTIMAEQTEGYSCNAWYLKNRRIAICLFDKNPT